jgi:hypothetical protein
MNVPTISEIAIKTGQGTKHLRNRNPDIVPEGTSLNEPMQRPGTVQPYAFDDRTFETFADGGGI